MSDRSRSPIISCRYGARCYRRNPDHLLKYWHPPRANDNIPVPRFESQENLDRRRAQIEADRQQREQELRLAQIVMEIKRLAMQLELQQKREEIERKRQTVEEDLQRQREIIETERQKIHEDSQQNGRMDENLRKSRIQMEEEQRKARFHLELVEERFRESMVNAEMEKKNLEQMVKKLREDAVRIAKSHEQLESALGQELENRERREIEKQRILEIRRDVPNYWGVKTFNEPYRQIEIQSSSPEFLMLRDFLNQTIQGHNNQYGTIDGKDPTEFIVTQITRIHNRSLWQQHCFKKVELR